LIWDCHLSHGSQEASRCGWEVSQSVLDWNGTHGVTDLNDRRSILILSLPSLMFLALFTVGVALMTLISFHSYIPPPAFYGTNLTTENYLSIFADRFALFTVGNTLILSFEAMLLTMLFAYPIAQLLVRPGSEFTRRLVSSFIILLLFLNSAVRSTTWITILGSSGLINSVLVGLNITQHPLSLLFTSSAVVLGISSSNMPYAILMLSSSLRYVGEDLEDAARTLGANEFQVFRRVTLPLSELAVIATGNLMFIVSLTAFVSPAILGGGVIPFITVNIFYTATEALNLPLSSAFSVFFTILTLAIVLIFGRFTNRFLSKGVRRGA
jgi:putative spermidine/putrescine transport system permease protein